MFGAGETDNEKQSRFGEAAAEKEAIARVDSVVPVGGGGVDAVVVAVLSWWKRGSSISRESGACYGATDRPPPPPRTESHRYLGADEHEPAIRSSTIVGLLVGNAHGERAHSLDESRPQVDLEPQEAAAGGQRRRRATAGDDSGGS